MGFGWRIWVARLQLVDGVLVERLILPVGRYFDLICGNALRDKEVLDALPTSLRQGFIVVLWTALVRIGSHRKFRVRVVLQVFRESISKRGQSVLLALHQSDGRIFFLWIVGREEDAIQQYCGNRLDAAGKMNSNCFGL